MKKTVLVFLVLSAVAIYSYNGYLLISLFTGRSDRVSVVYAGVESDIDDLLEYLGSQIHFREHGRSPFLAYEPKPVPPPKPAARPVKVAKPRVREKIDPPKITITGIMWNPSKPLAMITLPDGTGVVAQKGNSYGDIMVKSIQQDGITVIYRGSEFRIDR